MPFDFSVSDYSSQFEVAEIFAFSPYQDTNGDGEVSADDDDMLIVRPLTSGTALGNTPYLVRAKSSGEVTITANDGVLYAAASGIVRTATTKNIYAVTGTYKETTATADNGYYYLNGNAVTNVTSGSYTISPFRWYLNVTERTGGYASSGSSASAKPSYCIAVIGEDIEEATAISLIKALQAEAGSVYTIGGTRFNTKNLPAGIYIRNNKKIIVK